MHYFNQTGPSMKTIRVNWKVIAGPPDYKLNSLMDHDLLFDVKDFKIRQLDPKTRHFIEQQFK